MKRDHAFGVGLAVGDAQARVPVWISVQAVETESGDLAAASATPAQKQQRRSLMGIVQSLDGDHQAVQISAWDESGQGAAATLASQLGPGVAGPAHRPSPTGWFRERSSSRGRCTYASSCR